MNKRFKYASMLVIVVIIGFCAMYINGDIGINKSNIEKDARISQKVPDDWQVAKDTTDTMSAMIFYSESLSNHIFSLYVNRTGFSFGYFFRGGGSLVGVMEGIQEIYIKGYNERAFISMNKQQVSKIEIDNGNSIETIKIENKKPFVIILPVNIGSVTIYDINNNVVESQPQQL
ncbi:hypothetical protein SH1V18_19470 [Vallitalea longa]|uniref:Uncharacterized protein n=1 Tax=Vallitalea longa TaxID=2936439 RepID=A0A9W5Y909_9FIRM|nr:hypothetical protein [Vallitalea longa]GKX29467.1 hypothetical protein SH1V18_19470 [Vallitalea longa]